MNVQGFISVASINKKPIRPSSEYCWHKTSLFVVS
jgi:hypothetical protein